MGDNSCKNLKELLEAEKAMLNIAFAHRVYMICKRQSTPSNIDFETAEEEFLNNGLNQWAEGFRSTYCSYVCSERESCDVFKNEVSKWNKYLKR